MKKMFVLLSFVSFFPYAIVANQCGFSYLQPKMVYDTSEHDTIRLNNSSPDTLLIDSMRLIIDTVKYSDYVIQWDYLWPNVKGYGYCFGKNCCQNIISYNLRPSLLIPPNSYVLLSTGTEIT